MKHFLIGLDGSPLAETILPFVAELAQRFGSKVTLLNVTHVPDAVVANSDRFGADEVVALNKVHALEYLRRQEPSLRQAGVSVDSAVAVGDAAKEIVEFASQSGVDVIALATHGRSGIQRWQHGSVAEGVLHTTHLPLLLIRPDGAWQAIPHEVQKVVVPLDGSPLAEEALALAESLAERFGVPLVLVRVIEPVALDFAVDPTGTVVYMDYQRTLDALKSVAEQYLNALSRRIATGKLRVEVLALFGTPAQTITGYLQEHPKSILVLASHGRSGFRRFLLGSVARQLVQRAGVPILLVHPTPSAEQEIADKRSGT